MLPGHRIAEPPAFDVVRVEPDGAALVAGRAAPGASVGILVDGTEIAQAEADASGRFVALLDLPASGAPRLLTLLATGDAGGPVPGMERVALAPTSVPPDAGDIAVAMAAPVAGADGGGVVTVPTDPLSARAGTDDSSITPDVMSPPVAADAANAPPPPVMPAPPVALLLSDAGARVLQDAAPAPAAAQPPTVGEDSAPGISIDVISYTVDGQVLLSGRAGSGVVRLYLDNRAVQDVPVDRGAWSAQLAETAPGLYTLRADGLAADGTVTARFETPFKRETRAALAAVLGRSSLPAQVATVRIAGTEAGAAIGIGAEGSGTGAMGKLSSHEAPSATGSVVGKTPASGALLPATVGATAAPPAQGRTGTAVADAAPEALAGVGSPVSSPEAADTASSTLSEAAPEPAAPTLSVTVQPGFTLWGIAEERFGSGLLYVQVFEANRNAIRDPDLIYPGQVFALPQGG